MHPSLPPESESVWLATTPGTSYLSLGRDLTVDVAIVGGGLTGLVAAWQLTEAGRSVAILEMRRIAGAETGHTTAHLTEEVDTRYKTVTKDFGRKAARLVAASSRDAIAWIERRSEVLGIDCGFERVPGFLYSERESDLDQLREEMEYARGAGVKVSFTRDIPLPFPTAGGLRVERQAQFHPRAFLLPMAERLRARGVGIFESTAVTSVTDGEPCQVETAHGIVTARDVIVAANVPVNNRVALITKLPAYRTYAIGVRLAGPTPHGLFWDTDDPYHYTRTQQTAEGSVVIIGGEDHKTGTEPDTEARFQALADWAAARLPVERVDYRWSGQIIEPVDGLPYIGLNTASEHVFVATGYSGNGMTFGTLAGLMTSAAILGRPNPFRLLYDATRFTPRASLKDYVVENLDFPKYVLRDRLTNADAERGDPAGIRAGEGRLFVVDGRKYAVCRTSSGELHTLSPVCPHMQCDVSWNRAEQTWDCPCHGSRFTAAGEVLNGPAVSALEPLDLPATKER
jgi:glycine/D-amino acid oxidase-like deaminating enzyme/nitrite reductase/ring-hydroxylating ferredoxin subunit